MPIGKDRFDAVVAHLARHKLVCPVCDSASWETATIVAPEPLDPAMDVVPTVQLVCGVCYHVMQFAWLPIERDRRFPLLSKALKP